MLLSAERFLTLVITRMHMGQEKDIMYFVERIPPR